MEEVKETGEVNMVHRFLKGKLHMAAKAFLIALVLLLAEGMPVHAMEPVELEMVVLQDFTLINADKLPEEGSEVTYRLSSVGEKQAPLPEGASDYYEFTLNKDQTLTLGKITFTNVGIYNYVLKRMSETPARGFQYADQVYEITVQAKRIMQDSKWVLVLDWTVTDATIEIPEDLPSYKVADRVMRYQHRYGIIDVDPDDPNDPDDPDKPDDPKDPDDKPSDQDKPGTPPNTPGTGGSVSPNAAKTGDESNILLYAGLAAVALAGFGLVLYFRKKEQKDIK